MRDATQRAALADEFAAVLNRHSAENESDTPDFVLSLYLVGCLEAYEEATRQREAWHGPAVTQREPPRSP